MKKLLFVLALVSFQLQTADAQTLRPLTVREGYDFAIGDTLMYADSTERRIVDQGVSGHSTHYKQIQVAITDKWQRNDSLFYKRKFTTVEDYWYYLYTHYPTINKHDTTISRQVDTLILTRLDSSILSVMPKCGLIDSATTCTRQDTVFILGTNYNGRLSTQANFAANTFYYPGSQYVTRSTLINTRTTKGLGISFYFYSFYNTYDHNKDSTSIRTLKYYRKGTEIWGTPFLIAIKDTVSSVTKDSTATLKLVLSPNPTANVLHLHAPVPFDEVILLNFEGKAVFYDKNSPITERNVVLRDLPNGIYFVQVFKDKILRGVNKFVLKH